MLLTLADAQVSTETVSANRRTTKTLATPAEAAAYFERQEWGLLKKGYVLHDPAAAPGQPQLHCYVGAGYTGSLALAATPVGSFVYQHGWFRGPGDQQDFLVQFDEAGQVLATRALPTVLAWDAHYQPAWHALVLDLDHHIFTYDLASEQFELLQAPGPPVSFVAVAAGRTAYAAGKEVVVLDAYRRVQCRIPFTTQVVKGTIPFAAALAGNGEVLAVHYQPGEIELRSARDGTLQRVIATGTGRVRQLAFAGGDQLLLLWLEQPGLRAYDLGQGRETALPPALTEASSNWVQSICLRADQSRLAVRSGPWVEVFDGATWQPLQQRFRLAHCVKTAQLRFMDDALGVRTDYGCFSRYRVA